jgi:DNA-directed RNA polymerase specialized sigma24 family protein
VCLLGLREALNGLAEMDPQQTRIVELKFFSGLSMDEIVDVLGIGHLTVKHDVTTLTGAIVHLLR